MAQPLRLGTTTTITNDEMRRAAARARGSYLGAPAAPAAAATTPAAPRAASGPGGVRSSLSTLSKTKTAGIGVPLATAGAVIGQFEPDAVNRYATRFGVAAPEKGEVVKPALLRAGGFASDLGNALTLGAAGNVYRDRPPGLLQFNSDRPTPAIGANIPPTTPSATPAARPTPARVPAIASPSTYAAVRPPATVPSVATIGGTEETGKVRVERQPNGVLSFSGSGSVSGYDGPDAESLRGGTLNVVPAIAPQTAGQGPGTAGDPAVRAALAAAAERGDFAAVRDFYQQNGGSYLGQVKPRFDLSTEAGRAEAELAEKQADRELKRYAIGEEKKPSILEQEQAQGLRIQNQSAQRIAALTDAYLNAKTPEAQKTALSRLAALTGSSKSKKDGYIKTKTQIGTDEAGGAIYGDILINPDTGDVIDPSTAGERRSGGEEDFKEGDEFADPATGKMYVYRGGEFVPS